MNITTDEIARLGVLARIAIPESKRPALAADMSQILGLIHTMQATDTRGVAPLAHPSAFVADVALRLREDVVTEPNDIAGRDARLHNAPATQDGLFLVPKVIE